MNCWDLVENPASKWTKQGFLAWVGQGHWRITMTNTASKALFGVLLIGAMTPGAKTKALGAPFLLPRSNTEIRPASDWPA